MKRKRHCSTSPRTATVAGPAVASAHERHRRSDE
jgi:hypothetical protein